MLVCVCVKFVEFLVSVIFFVISISCLELCIISNMDCLSAF